MFDVQILKSTKCNFQIRPTQTRSDHSNFGMFSEPFYPICSQKVQSYSKSFGGPVRFQLNHLQTKWYGETIINVDIDFHCRMVIHQLNAILKVKIHAALNLVGVEKPKITATAKLALITELLRQVNFYLIFISTHQ